MLNHGYTVRRGRNGWSVYAVHTGKPVRVNERVQTGLSRETAIELLASLRVFAFIEAESGEQPIVKGRSVD
ncbi:hypothetical protein [Methylobacterium nodulans]|uniref:Uncharacterized protein n=1 Tax=Methylobacterium nodulans (strain LMG 21967 / CNCM I-2342 / ORS 2060) TaxID=460265 RepID=B8IKY7_METNO|nr:hypothetical protein [Methylobacterium nodulans]ACL58175.1 conserved hypothetical protein [Methylobacterium nodulans ORS 2060]